MDETNGETMAALTPYGPKGGLCENLSYES
jgi:hypothetical protein